MAENPPEDEIGRKRRGDALQQLNMQRKAVAAAAAAAPAPAPAPAPPTDAVRLAEMERELEASRRRELENERAENARLRERQVTFPEPFERGARDARNPPQLTTTKERNPYFSGRGKLLFVANLTVAFHLSYVYSNENYIPCYFTFLCFTYLSWYSLRVWFHILCKYVLPATCISVYS